MSQKLIATAVTASFLLVTAAPVWAQTATSPTRSTTSTAASPKPSTTIAKKRVDCPGNSENSQGKAAQKNPNCVQVPAR